MGRARNRLSEGNRESLFYAAFELRSGIEARMNEYLEAWDHISKKKKKGWRIAKMGRNIEGAFKTGNKIARLAVHDKQSDELIICLYYTPVTSSLKKDAEKLGNYMHSMKKYKSPSDKFWIRLRNDLEKICERLDLANTGTLLGPPLRKNDTGEVKMNMEFLEEDSGKSLLDSIMNSGAKIKVNITYISSLPEPIESKAHVWQSNS